MTGTNYEDLWDLPCLQVISELNNIPQLSASDPDSNMSSKVNFDYYSISDYSSSVDIQNSLLLRSFSILNCNIRSLNHLIQMLADIKFPFALLVSLKPGSILTIQWLIIFRVIHSYSFLRKLN